MSEQIRVEETPEESIIKVASATPAGTLGSAVSHAVQSGKPVALRAVGAGAVNQGIKAIAIARGYLAPLGFNITCLPAFCNVRMPDNQELSGILLRIVAN